MNQIAEKFSRQALIRLTRKNFLDTIRRKGEKFFSEEFNVLLVIDDKVLKDTIPREMRDSKPV